MFEADMSCCMNLNYPRPAVSSYTKSLLCSPLINRSSHSDHHSISMLIQNLGMRLADMNVR